MPEQIPPVLAHFEEKIRRALGSSLDVRYRPFVASLNGERRGLLIYLDGLADEKKVQEVLKGVIQHTQPPFEPQQISPDPMELLRKAVLCQAEVQPSRQFSACVEAVMVGRTVLALDGSSQVLLISTTGNPGRSVQEPSAEKEVQGPRDGFVEHLPSNLALIRRRIRDPRLQIQSIQVGQRTKTTIAIAYLKDVAGEELIAEVRKRLEEIRIDAIHGAGALEELIRDSPSTPFPLIHLTERPDRAAANILEGRVVIATDNSPFVMIVPTSFWGLFQAAGDYYQHYLISTAYRVLRIMAFLVALTLPAAYVMLTTFHHEMLPTPLALTVASGREGTPFPTVLEVLLMEVMFEVMHEAGLRLPTAVGQTVSIVGALVIGDAAVQAGLIAPGTVMVVASTGIAGFALPSYPVSLAVRFVRFGMLILAGTLGVFGFLLGTSILALHMTSLRSFGVPYLAPYAPYRPSEQEDSAMRAPWWRLRARPDMGAGGSVHQAPDQQPEAPGARQ